MDEQTHVVQRASKARGLDVHSTATARNQPAQTYPLQLTLFQTFFSEKNPSEDATTAESYSNTIELYDAIPKYIAHPRVNGAKLERDFVHRGTAYTVQIWPAHFEARDRSEKKCYPSYREELVEEALRKLACDRLNGIYLDDEAGVRFTLYELKKELRSRGHDINLQSLIESLNICNRVVLTVCQADGKVMLQSAIFPVLLLGSKQEWRKNPKETYCYVQFHPFITRCINRLTYRQFNYGAYMSYKHRLSRWLHKRLAHNYTQAGILHPYTIRMSTILRDSGTHIFARAHDNVRHVDKILEELTERDVLLSSTKEVLRGSRNSLVDVKYSLLPTMQFIQEVKKANVRTAKLAEQRQRSVGKDLEE